MGGTEVLRHHRVIRLYTQRDCLPSGSVIEILQSQMALCSQLPAKGVNYNTSNTESELKLCVTHQNATIRS